MPTPCGTDSLTCEVGKNSLRAMVTRGPGCISDCGLARPSKPSCSEPRAAATTELELYMYIYIYLCMYIYIHIQICMHMFS